MSRCRTGGDDGIEDSKRCLSYEDCSKKMNGCPDADGD